MPGRTAYYPPSVGSSVESADITDASITLSDLAVATKADWEYAYSSYKTIRTWRGFIQQSLAVGTYVPFEEYGNITTSTATSTGELVAHLDPADYGAGSRTVKYRLKTTCLTNATAPTATFTVGLYPVTAVAGGASGAVTVTLGTVTSGSTVVFTTPAASTRAVGNSGDFTAPAAGFFMPAIVTTTATTAVNSSTAFNIDLQVDQV